MRRGILRGLLACAVGLAGCQPILIHRINDIPVALQEERLANGLVLHLAPEAQRTTVHLLLRLDVGAAHDPPQKRGLAHFVEHLAFRRGDRLSAEADARRRPRSPKHTWVAESGHTDLRETVFWMEVRPGDLPAALADLAGILGDFSGEIDSAVLAAEREVVRNERRSRYESGPLGRWSLDLFASFFPADHPYAGAGVIGSHAEIASFSAADVQAFLGAHYQPQNATLVISGAMEPTQTTALVAQAFGELPRGEAVPLALPSWTPVAREVVIDTPGAVGNLVTVAWPIGPRGGERHDALSLLGMIGGYRFDHNLGAYLDWAQWAYTDIIDDPQESLFVIQVLLRESRTIEATKRLVLPTARDLWLDLNHRSLAYAQDAIGHADLYRSEDPVAMAAAIAERGPVTNWLDRLRRQRALKVARVRQLAQEALTPARAIGIFAEVIRSGKGLQSYHRDLTVAMALEDLRFATRAERTYPARLARRALPATATRVRAPTARELARINFAAVEDHYQRICTPASVIVGVRTDLPAESIQRLFAAQFGTWRGPTPSNALVNAPPRAEAEARWPLVVVPSASGATSRILMLFAAPDSGTLRDTVVTEAAAALLQRHAGGLRKALGLTYAVEITAEMAGPQPRLWLAFSTDRAAQAAALQAGEQLVQRATDEALSREELEELKRGLIDRYVDRRSIGREVAREMTGLAAKGLPQDFRHRAVEIVAGLQADEIRGALAQIVARRLAVVVVGESPSGASEAALAKAAGFGGVVIRDVEALLTGE